MGKSIGLIELKSIPAGVQTADEMLKAANVELLTTTAICPGKYIIIISGQVGAVKSAMETGRQTAGTFLICHHTINNVHSSVPGALVGTAGVEKIASLGMVETMSALTIVRAADIAAKASTVKSAIGSCLNQLADTGDITSTCVIPSPHRGLLEKLI